MAITYSHDKEFDRTALQGLFLSVGWSSGDYPDELVAAMRNSHRVVSAWDGGTLVGLINSLSDGVMTAYFHYLLVRPEYQSRGIGNHLVTTMLEEYRDYARKVLIAYDAEVGFYEHCGFEIGQGKSPMFVTCLTT
ncbi:MAG: GNAT family N-acetyltransferase [Coriobacteriia bacterium]|nr:GNAT family N-acetyltransferase [Coriobacteriia bacterium]